MHHTLPWIEKVRPTGYDFYRVSQEEYHLTPMRVDPSRTGRKAHTELTIFTLDRSDWTLKLVRVVPVQIDILIKSIVRCLGTAVGGEKGIKMRQECSNGRV